MTGGIEGTSPAKTKRALQSSFLFTSAEIFYAGGPPADAALLPDLGTEQVQQLQERMSSTLEGLLLMHGRAQPAFAEVFRRPIPPAPKASVKVENSGQAIARVGRDAEISLDAKVLQAMFRAALIPAFTTEIYLARIAAEPPGGEAPAWTPEDDQRVAVREMLALKARVEALEARSVVGEVLADDTDLRSAHEGGSGWFALQGLARVSNEAERSYTVQQILLLGHELGHLVLGHQQLALGGLDCAALLSIEQEADLYAVLLLSLSTPGDAFQDFLGMFGNSLGKGLDDLFVHAYEFAGFEAASVTARCPPAAPAERLAAARKAYDEVRSTQIQTLLERARHE